MSKYFAGLATCGSNKSGRDTSILDVPCWILDVHPTPSNPLTNRATAKPV